MLATHKFAAWVVPKSLFIVTENDVIGYFRSAANMVYAAGTTANFSVREYLFSRLSRKMPERNLKSHHHVRHRGCLIVSQIVGFS